MSGRGHFPNYLPGMVALGAKRLRELAGFHDVAVGPKDTPEQIAQAMLRAKGTPGDVSAHFDDAADVEVIGVALGLGRRAAWKSKLSPAEFERLPFYRKPSYEGDVLAKLGERVASVLPKPRPVAKTKPAKWPELASFAKWSKAARRDVAKKIAAANKALKTPALTGEHELARVRHTKLGLDFVAIPGGVLKMGLSPKEAKELAAVAQGPEAEAHLKELTKRSRPVHEVAVAPFLVATLPLSRAQLEALGAEVVDEMPSDAARTTGQEAARAVAKAGARLLSDAEWEWLARAGGARSWLAGSETPEAWAERLSSGGDDGHPFGVAGLGWGEWVDDGWHDSYKGAPKTSAAWEPVEWPMCTRGGALALWPWQVGGEVILGHAACRDRAVEGVQCVRLALDLPAR